MILDKLQMFSESQVVTASAASTSVVDLGAAGEAIGNELYLVVQVPVAATATGAATVAIDLETDSDEAFGTKQTLFSSGPIGKAALSVGAEPVKVKLPIGLKRYLRLSYTVATGPLTAGKFTAFLTPQVQVK